MLLHHNTTQHNTTHLTSHDLPPVSAISKKGCFTSLPSPPCLALQHRERWKDSSIEYCTRTVDWCHCMYCHRYPTSKFATVTKLHFCCCITTQHISHLTSHDLPPVSFQRKVASPLFLLHPVLPYSTERRKDSSIEYRNSNGTEESIC